MITDQEFGESTKLTVYLAGRIEHTCWRHGVISGLRGKFYDPDGDRYNWPVLKNAIFGEHHYCGPYFMACDHGCCHGEGTHGQGERCGDRGYGNLEHRRMVHKICRKAIDTCSLMFAWIDSVECFGTLWELGYAASRRCDIVTAFDGTKLTTAEVLEMWFALHGADMALCSFAGPKKTLRTVVSGELHIPWDPMNDCDAIKRGIVQILSATDYDVIRRAYNEGARKSRPEEEEEIPFGPSE